MSTLYAALGGNSGYVPSASEGLIIGYSRNANDFMLPRWVGNKPVLKRTGLYQRFNPAVGARTGANPATDALWAPGADRPNGLKNQEEFELSRYSTFRYDEPVNTDRVAMEQVDWAVSDHNARNLAQLCMTRRTQLALAALSDPTTGLTGSATAPVSSSKAGNIINKIFGPGATGNLASASTAQPALLGVLNYAAKQINLGTYGVLKPRDLTVLFNPNTATTLSMVPEIQNAFIQSPFAKSLIVGDDDTAIAAWNAQWGLPVALRGYNFIIEDTVADSGKPGDDPNPGYAMPDNVMYLLATPGGLDNRYMRADITGNPQDGSQDRYFPVSWTVTEFMYQDMMAENFDDVRNRRNDSHISYDLQYQCVSSLSGFALTDLFD